MELLSSGHWYRQVLSLSLSLPLSPLQFSLSPPSPFLSSSLLSLLPPHVRVIHANGCGQHVALLTGYKSNLVISVDQTADEYDCDIYVQAGSNPSFFRYWRCPINCRWMLAATITTIFPWSLHSTLLSKIPVISLGILACMVFLGSVITP